MGIVSVCPVHIVRRITRSLGWHQTQRGQLPLLTISVPVGNDDGCEQENSEEVMAKDAKHARAIHPTAQDQEHSVKSHED